MFGELDMLLTSSSSDEDNEVLGAVARRRKVYKPRVNFVFESALEFNERFRMSADKLEALCLLLGEHLSHHRRGGALSVKQQLAVALYWLGSGAQFHTVADMHSVSKATVCRCVKAVVQCVNTHMLNVEIAWPEDIGSVVAKFYEVDNFPQVCGVIDGMLVNIDAPNVNEEAFVDRHGNHSINCMFVCGPTCIFYYVNARWPGSVHDSRVLRNSTLFDRMEAGQLFPNAIIIGDSGYPLKTWLMTPLHQDPNDPGERRYNRRLKATRQTVERSLGILKEKFPCLNHLRVEPTYAGSIVQCCAVLCNFARKDEDEAVALLDQDDDIFNDDFLPDQVVLNEHGRPVPQALLRQRHIVNLMR